jgi:hypothetical protein
MEVFGFLGAQTLKDSPQTGNKPGFILFAISRTISEFDENRVV